MEEDDKNREGRYPVFRIHYETDSNPSLFAEVSPNGSGLYDNLTESEILLKKEITGLKKSIAGYKLYGIESMTEKSDKVGVRYNTLN